MKTLYTTSVGPWKSSLIIRVAHLTKFSEKEMGEGILQSRQVKRVTIDSINKRIILKTNPFSLPQQIYLSTCKTSSNFFTTAPRYSVRLKNRSREKMPLTTFISFKKGMKVELTGLRIQPLHCPLPLGTPFRGGSIGGCTRRLGGYQRIQLNQLINEWIIGGTLDPARMQVWDERMRP